MRFPPDIPVYGDQSFRGKCPAETLEQVTFFNRVRRDHPKLWGLLALHPRNEGKRTTYGAMREKAEGMATGACDIVIPGAPAFVCELKRRDHTLSVIQREQVEYLVAAKEAGCFVCIALGVEAAWEAFNEYLAGREKTERTGF